VELPWHIYCHFDYRYRKTGRSKSGAVVLSVSLKCDAFIWEDQAVLELSDPSRSLKAWWSTHAVTRHHFAEDLNPLLIFFIPGLMIRIMSFLQLWIITTVPLSTGHSSHIALEIACSEGIHGGCLKPHPNLIEWTQVSSVCSEVNVHWETLVSSGSKAYLYRHQCFLLLWTCIKVHN
jgi:hypothetical protein